MDQELDAVLHLSEYDWHLVDSLISEEGAHSSRDQSTRPEAVSVNPGRAALLEAISVVGTAKELSAEESARIWSALSNRIEAGSGARINARQSGLRKIYGYRKPAMALALATVITVLTIVAGLWIHGKSRAESESAGLQLLEWTTATGQQRHIQLDDQTSVVLAPESRLSTSKGFNRTSRTVSLYGEGYFEITGSSKKPFIVNTYNSTVVVLGTTLNIRDYSDTSIVAVTQGKVQVSGRKSDGKSLTLSAGDVARVGASGNLQLQRGASQNYVGWMIGNFSFDEAPLQDVLKVLERHFGLYIRLTDSVEMRVTAEWKDRGPMEILNSISKLLNAQLERNGNVVWLVVK